MGTTPENGGKKTPKKPKDGVLESTRLWRATKAMTRLRVLRKKTILQLCGNGGLSLHTATGKEREEVAFPSNFQYIIGRKTRIEASSLCPSCFMLLHLLANIESVCMLIFSLLKEKENEKKLRAENIQQPFF